MFVPAAVRSVLAFAALAAIGVSTFLPALHVLPGLTHADCGCDGHATPQPLIAAGAATGVRPCHENSDHDAANCCRGTASSESKTRSLGLNRAGETDDACLLCDLFASFLLAPPERGFVPASIEAATSLETPVARRVDACSRAAACRGPPVGV